MHPVTRRPVPAQPRRRSVRGFTLAEVAIVLVILTLLTGTLLAPIGARMEERSRRETATRLLDIEQALIGFAILHGRLPCPTTEPDPASPGYGLEQNPPCNHAIEGYLPWRTLGTHPVDAWGSVRDSASAPWTGHWRYRPDTGFTNAIITPATTTQSNIQLRDHAGNALTTVSSSRAAVVFYSTGANRTADGLNASHSASSPAYQAGELASGFDDQVHWIGHPFLVARLAQAGRL